MMAKTVLGQSSWIVDSSMVVADLRGAMEFDIILPTTGELDFTRFLSGGFHQTPENIGRNAL